jgi:hypothetical protein
MGTMVTMSRNDRHLSCGRMVRQWISRCAFGIERLSSAAE